MYRSDAVQAIGARSHKLMVFARPGIETPVTSKRACAVQESNAASARKIVEIAIRPALSGRAQKLFCHRRE